tara:strand:+ start:300 stop:668 length:369 start_codon:yes stop_codon:yes gene_type:complete
MRMTEKDVSAYIARQAAKSGKASETATPDGKEHQLHSAIQDECSRQGWLALTGAMSRRTHRTKGEPDFIILGDQGRRWDVECKTKNGKLSIDQRAIQAHYKKLGHGYYVIRSIEEFLELTKL